MYLRLLDYDTVIRRDSLSEILKGDPFIRHTLELAAKEKIESYLRHRYDLRRVLQPLKEFSLLNTYYTGDLIVYSEPTYSATTPYTAGDRCSYTVSGYEYIYEALVDTTGNLPTNTTYWSQITENESLYFANRESVTNLPTASYSVTEGDYLTGYDYLLGWDRNTEIYFKKVDVGINAQEIRIYTSISDMSANINYVGRIEYTEHELNLPSIRPVLAGVNNKISFGGYVTIKDFIPDGESWSVSSTNYFTKGDNRNQLLLNLFLKIAIYELHYTINPRNLPQLRIDAYKEAIAMLEMAAKGQITMDLPTYDTQPEKGQRIQWKISDNRKYSW